jgi:hypothetical protein
MRTTWASRQMHFIEQYAAALITHIMTAKQHFQLYENAFSRGLAVGLIFFENEEIVMFISKLLGYQDRLLSIVKIPSIDSNNSIRNATLARRAACEGIIEQCKLLQSVLCFLILHLEKIQQESKKDVIDIQTLKEQMEAQEQYLYTVEREYS